MSRQLDEELLAIVLTNQLSVTTGSSVTAPPSNTEEGSTEMWPSLAPYNNSDGHIGDVGDEITDELYRE